MSLQLPELYRCGCNGEFEFEPSEQIRREAFQAYLCHTQSFESCVSGAVGRSGKGASFHLSLGFETTRSLLRNFALKRCQALLLLSCTWAVNSNSNCSICCARILHIMCLSTHTRKLIIFTQQFSCHFWKFSLMFFCGWGGQDWLGELACLMARQHLLGKMRNHCCSKLSVRRENISLAFDWPRYCIDYGGLHGRNYNSGRFHGTSYGWPLFHAP